MMGQELNLSKGITMFHMLKNRRVFVLPLGALLILVLAAASPALGGEDQARIKGVKPPPHFDAEETNISKTVRSRFDVVGTVNATFEDRVVISDRNFRLAPDADTHALREGAFIGASLNDEGEITAAEPLEQPER
ncbi:MAG TPA: hypothetical protein VKO20_04615 [Desulfosalsimonadaceae bacterium]|nr:hypothetical protein [Desulfosalsimonadaceae bacterium]